MPFDVVLENGRRIEVSPPENVVVFPSLQKVREILVYYPERDDYSIIMPLGITTLHVARRPEGTGG